MLTYHSNSEPTIQFLTYYTNSNIIIQVLILPSKFWPYHPNVAAVIKTRQTRKGFFIFLLSIFCNPLASFSCSHRSSTRYALLLQSECVFRNSLLYAWTSLDILLSPFNQQRFSTGRTTTQGNSFLFLTIFSEP